MIHSGPMLEADPQLNQHGNNSQQTQRFAQQPSKAVRQHARNARVGLVNSSDAFAKLPGPPFRGTLSPPATSITLARNIDFQKNGCSASGVDRVICELTREVGRQVIASAFLTIKAFRSESSSLKGRRGAQINSCSFWCVSVKDSQAARFALTSSPGALAMR